jgi:hypothetical protein
VQLGHELFDRLGVPQDKEEPTDVGNKMSDAVSSDLGHRRPDLKIGRDRPAFDFAQYKHLGALAELRKRRVERLGQQLDGIAESLKAEHEAGHIEASAYARIGGRIARLSGIANQADDQLQTLVEQLGTESLLKIDVTVARSTIGKDPTLAVGLSGKWSLRTDRAQDCVSQGGKLVSLRRGHMPHFALITLEPRPAMLALVADGGGSVDCVYHLALPQLIDALKAMATTKSERWSPMATLDRLLRQGRLRDYDELVAVVDEIPS